MVPSERLMTSLIHFVAIFIYPFLFVLCTLQVILKRLLCKPSVKCVRDDVALVTGGGGGLGRALCDELAQRGCHLAIVDVNLAAAEQVAMDMSHKYNVKAKAYQADVTDHGAVVQLRSDISADIGDVTVLVNNAGLMFFKDMLKPDWREVQAMINVNLTSHFSMNEVFLPKMKEKRRGCIIATSSVAGLFAISEIPVYCATKFGVRALMRSMRLNLQMEGYNEIQVCTAYPYFMYTSAMVNDFIHSMNFQKLYAPLPSSEAAARIIQGALSNESDVTLPEFFIIIYRFAELLPNVWRERLTGLVTRHLTERFRTNERNKYQSNGIK